MAANFVKSTHVCSHSSTSQRAPCRHFPLHAAQLRCSTFVNHARQQEPQGCGASLRCSASTRDIDFLWDDHAEVTGGPLTMDSPIEEEQLLTSTPGLSWPEAYQQTLARSFIVGGLGLHSGDYTCIRVRPAFAGEGRYFVRVPPGTNSAREHYQPEELDELAESLDEIKAAASADYDVDHFLLYLKAQDMGYAGSFQEYSRLVWKRDESGKTIEFDLQEAAEKWLEQEDQLVMDVELPEEERQARQQQLAEARESWEELKKVREEQGLKRFRWLESQEDTDDVIPRSPEDDVIPATLAHAVPGQLHNIVLENKEAKISIASVEHLLSALEAMGVDNARIEYESGSEIPVLDGSAQPWCIHVQRAGVRAAPPPGFNFGDYTQSGSAAGSEDKANDDEAAPSEAVMGATGQQSPGVEEGKTKDAAVAAQQQQQAQEQEEGERVWEYRLTPRFYSDCSEAITVRDGDAFISYNPEDTPRLTYGIDHQDAAPVIGKQWHSYSLFEDDHYRWHIAPARTYFTSMQEMLELRQAGFVKGGTTGCCIIAEGETWYDEIHERFDAQEAVRHRMLDFMGDMSLLAQDGHAGMPRGHIVCYKGNHLLHRRFLQELHGKLTLTEGALEVQEA